MPYLESHYGAYIVHGRGHGPEGTLVQTDWDYPSTADMLGWSLVRVQRVRVTPRPADPLKAWRTVELARRPKHGCDHRSTDGTVDCRECGVTASEFIAAAGRYLERIAR